MKSNINKKIVATASAVALVVGVIGGAALFPREVIKEVEVEKLVPGPTQVEKVEVPVEVVKEVEVAKFVDNGRMAEVLDFILEKDGNVHFLTEDLDDGEAMQIADLVADALFYEGVAINEVRADAVKELHREVVEGVELDKDDISSLKIKDEDLEYDVADFDGGDLDILVPVTFRQDDDRFKAVLRARFINKEFDELDIESIEKLE